MRVDKRVGACGILCCDCAAYQATQTSDPEELRDLADIESSYLGRKITPGENGCDGCLAEGGKQGPCVAGCKIRACAKARGIVTCAECGDFPCDLLAALFAHHPQAKQVLTNLAEE